MITLPSRDKIDFERDESRRYVCQLERNAISITRDDD